MIPTHKNKPSKPIDSDEELIAAFRLLCRALRIKGAFVENSAGTLDFYLDVVGGTSKRRGIRITLRKGVLIGIKSRAQCNRDLFWKYFYGESAQSISDRILAERAKHTTCT